MSRTIIQTRGFVGSALWALVWIIAMTILRIMAEQALGDTGPVIFFFAAVIGAAFSGGATAGLIATIVSVPTIVFFFLPPRLSLLVADFPNVILLAIFVIEGLLISLLAYRVRVEHLTLETSEEKYRVFSDAIPLISWVMNSEGTVEKFNRRWYEYTGMTEEASLNGGWLNAMPPEERAIHAERRSRAIKQGLPFESETRLKGLDGRYRWFAARVQPLRNQNGQIISWYGAAVEIEERKRAEKALLVAKEAAENANQAKSQFLANMSHEIRTPMNAILGFADLLMESEISGAERIEFASRIKSNGDQLLHLIDDILDLSKVEAGKIPIEKLSFSFIELAQEVLDNLSPLAEKKGVELRVSFKTAIPQVIQSDPMRLKQILMNLIGNALKFTDEGHVELVLRYLQGQSLNNGVLQIGVEDTGIGIDPEKQKNLFLPFSQADNAISRRYGGTGLGLTLSRRLSQALGGDLYLTKSTPGQGSCFTLNIDTGNVADSMFVSNINPRFHAEPKPMLRVTGPNAEQLKGLRVLLAEDSPDGAVLVRLYLQMEGASVEIAINGFEVLAELEKQDFDVVLMDVQMPGLDGLEATRRLRARGYTKPIIALTAHALKEEVERSMRAGCDLHLAKPIRRGDLVRGILSQVQPAHRETGVEI